MEVLSGLILLLQVVISIQIMLMRKRMLQRMAGVEKKIDDAVKRANNTSEQNQKESIAEDLTLEQKAFCQVKNCKEPEKSLQNVSREALLNEVLSEVFS